MTQEEEFEEVFGLRKDIIDKTSRRVSMKHGLFANTPILCQGDACAYCNVCKVPHNLRIADTRCPMEAGALVARYKYWLAHFNIDSSKEEFKEDDRADVSLIVDLVKTEVMIMRTENKIAIDGDFIAETIVDVDKKCHEHRENCLHPALEYQMKLIKQKNDILRLLNATRKDKAGLLKPEQPNSESVTIIQTVKKRAMEKNIDLNKIDFSKMEDVSQEQLLKVTKKETIVNNVNNDNTNSDVANDNTIIEPAQQQVQQIEYPNQGSVFNFNFTCKE